MTFKLAVVALVLAAGPVAAQEKRDTTHPMQEDMRSPGLALVLEGWIVIAPVGHWYAGDVKRGLLPTAVKLGGIPLLLMCVDMAGGSAVCSATEEAVSGLGALMFVGGWIWGMASAYRTASDRNQAIRTRDGPVEMSYGIRPSRRRLEFTATLRLRR